MAKVSPMRVGLLLATVTLLGALPAQHELPRLLRLAPMPQLALSAVVDAEGRVEGTETTGVKGYALALAPLLDRRLQLSVDRRAPWGRVARIIEQARVLGQSRIYLVGELPNGKTGCFVLALPEVESPPATAMLRLHRDRPGVPPTSVVPLLRRMRSGIEAARFTLALTAPEDAAFEAVLQGMAAVADAGVARLVVSATNGTADAEARHKMLAMDLGPIPVQQVVVPQARPGILDGAHGCLERPGPDALTFAGGKAGGRFGARNGRGQQQTPHGKMIQQGLSWLRSEQRPDGSYLDDGSAPDLEATALVLLAHLGSGATLDADMTVRRGTGWLVARQRDDGGLADAGPNSVRRHALATYALAQACRLSADGALLRGSVQDALTWLTQQRAADGGFADGTPDAAPDRSTTALALCALTTANFLGLEPKPTSAETVAWFETAKPPADDTQAIAMTLYSRFFAPIDPGRVPALKQVANNLAMQATTTDPWGTFWTTSALFLAPGVPWQTWAEKLTAIEAEHVATGALAGSWNPPAGYSRATTTALRLLTMRALHRYAPLGR